MLRNNRYAYKSDVEILETAESIVVLQPANGKWLGYPKSYAPAILALRRGIREDLLSIYGKDLPTVLRESYKLGLIEGSIGSPPSKDIVADCPEAVTLNIGLKCNLHCRYCYAEAGADNYCMDGHTLNSTLELIEQSNLPSLSLNITGGEPLLYFDLLNYVVTRVQESFINSPLSIKVQTNGTLLNEANVNWLKNNKIELGISLDGPSQVHDYHRVYPNGRGSFDTVMGGVSLLREKELNFTTISVIEKPEAILKLWDFALEHNLKGVSCNLLENIGRGEKVFSPNEMELLAQTHLEFLDRSLDLLTATGNSIVERMLWIFIGNLTGNKRPFLCHRSPCGAGHYKVYINYDGWIYPCDRFVVYPETRLGHVNDVQTLQELINNSAIAEICKARTVSNIEECSACTFRTFCGGGCSASAYSVDNEFKKPSPYCDYYKQLLLGIMERITLRPRDMMNYFQANYYN